MSAILIDLGSGKNKIKKDGFLVFGIDKWVKSDHDIRASVLELPIKSNSVDYIYSRHLLEHFTYEQLIQIFKECFRILKENGTFEIIVPHSSCISAFQDPTHRTFFTKRTFYKFSHTGFNVKQIQFHWFRKPYKGRFKFLVTVIEAILNRFQTLERFSYLIGGIYEVSCIMKKSSSNLNPFHVDGAKIGE